ncbi:helix-turn-helix transcriptional regulator [Dactylosporangium sp. NPDC051485]|uniref:helix-turn-helix domain-containing protein n=1 Tax=Dactylosporangium sp. NPDC051485 TaxID=3154846 RepID=UPI0034174DBA
MGQAARLLTPDVSVHHRFGAELRRWRQQRGLSQNALGRLVHASGDLIGKIEKAERWPGAELARRCDHALDSGDALARLVPQLDQERRRKNTSPPAAAMSMPDPLDRFVASALPPTADRNGADRRVIDLPAGSLFMATSLTAWYAPLVKQTRANVFTAPIDLRAARPGDVLVAQDLDTERPRFFAAEARRRPPSGNEGIVIPAAYVVDDFALGILWATRAVDDALHDDDRTLADAIDRLRQSPPSHGSADLLADGLTATSEGWMGSFACASFIGSQLDRVSGPPLFWTREQRGEEAAAWLLFEHKLDYLRRLRNRFADRNTPMARVFCLPEPVLGPTAERTLLLLAAALMEAMGVAVQVCGDLAYAAVEGFVLTPTGGVIVANWLRSGRGWHGDVISCSATASAYQDAIGFGRAHNIVAADDAAGRLQRLAEYLEIDWAWFTARAAQMYSAGVDGFVQPRSRLLSTAGMQIACKYLAQVRGHQQP